MPPSARLIPPLLAWSGLATPAWAQSSAVAGAADEASVWGEVFRGAPGAWAALAVLAIAAAALSAHLAYVLASRRGAPAKLTEALKYAIDAGNYQEAWETCGRWRAAFLARILQPALERIGQGRDQVEAALEQRFSRERRFVSWLTWSLVGLGGGLPLLDLLAAWMGFAGLSRPGGDDRALTLAAGDFALFAAATFAVVVTSVILWFGFRGRARQQLPLYREEAARFVQALAYEDLEGLRIGLDFDAGSIQGAEGEISATGKLRVSRELTTACPNCNAPINPSRNPCPYCGSPFEWS